MSSPLLWGPNNTSNNLQNQILLANGQLLSNNGPKNYIANNNFENGTTTGWSLFTTTLTNKIPTGSISAGAANLEMNLISSAGNFLSGTTSLRISKTTGNCSAQGLISDAFTIDREDKAKILAFKFSYEVVISGINTSGTSDNSYAVYIYDVTNSQWIQPAGVYNMVQNSGVGVASGTFQTSANGTQYRIALVCINDIGTSYPLAVDNFFVGPQVTSIAPAMSDWKDYTPIWSSTGGTPPTLGNGTLAGKYRRSGDTCDFEIVLTTGSTTNFGSTSGQAYTFSLPFTYDSTKTSAGVGDDNFIGTARLLKSATNRWAGLVSLNGLNSIKLWRYAVNAASSSTDETLQANGTYSNTVPVTWGSGDVWVIKGSFPVAGWSSNTVSSADTDTRVVAASFTASKASSTTLDQLTFASTLLDNTNSKSGNTWIVPVSGFYKITGTTTFSTGNASISDRVLHIYINGTSYYSVTSTGSYNTAVSIASIYSAKAGDVISFYGQCVSIAGTTSGLLNIERLSGPAVVQATESISALYSGAPPTGSLGAAYNVVTYGTKIKDTHAAYSGGVWSCPGAGSYSIVATLDIGATFTGGQAIAVAIYKNGSTQIAQGYWKSTTSATIFQFVIASVQSYPLLAGDTITVKSYCDGTSPSFSSTAVNNQFSIVRVGN